MKVMKYFLTRLLLLLGAVFAQPALAQEVDDIREAKDLIEIPVPPNYALWCGIALGILLLAVLIWKLLTRKRPMPARTAAERALGELKECEALIEVESPEPLANRVTAAVRCYIEERFGIAAPRRTTEEFLRDVSTHNYPDISPYSEDLSRFLRFCDALKFGQGEVGIERRSKLIDSARRFVEATRHPQAPDAEPETAKPVAA